MASSSNQSCSQMASQTYPQTCPDTFTCFDMKGPCCPVIDERIQNADGRVTKVETPLAKTIAHACEKALKKRYGTCTHYETMVAFVKDAYFRQYGTEPTATTSYADLAMVNTTAGMAARWLGWLGFDTDNDPVLKYLYFKDGVRVALYPGGPYIMFRDYMYLTAFEL